jgi:uncharacterized membrane-anchored protein
MRLRLLVIGAALLAALAWFNWQVAASERHIAEGRPIFFELGGYDPRSLIQGDYVALRYSLTDELTDSELPPAGQLAVKADTDGVVTAARYYTPGTPLADGEFLVNYHRSGWAINVGPDSFFFQEGEADRYTSARFAELRVLPSGATVLVSLRGDDLELLGRTLFE